MFLQAVQYGRQEILQLQAPQWSPLLCAGQQLHGPAATGVARKGVESVRKRLEDLLHASPSVLFGREAWAFARITRDTRADAYQVWREPGTERTRTLLRTNQAAAGYLLLHPRMFGQGARKRHRPLGYHGK